VIELVFFGGLTHDQIAALTDVQLCSVKGGVRLGLRRLRRDLQDLAAFSPETQLGHLRAA
jgi:DNA-directed RNA polymerase specialized sigma24 family protein